jgi:hypothetical protein
LKTRSVLRTLNIGRHLQNLVAMASWSPGFVHPCIRGHKITSDDLNITPEKNGHKSFSETRPSKLTSGTAECEMDEELTERPRKPSA